MKPRIIVFSSVRMSPQVLREMLHELFKLESETSSLEFWFYDDNDNVESSRLIQEFCSKQKLPTRVLPKLGLKTASYRRTEQTHKWNAEVVGRVIQIKNFAIAEFLQTDAEALFLVDADLCLHPRTVEHLYALRLPIVSEVFWTKWWPNAPYLPNVWDVHDGRYFSPESILRLREPGQYKVGGLGACTLIRREPLERGLDFSLVESLDFNGEDRHFCVRAVCLGFPLIADTVYPPFHIYRESQVTAVAGWRARGYERLFFVSLLDEEWEKAIKASVNVSDHFLKPKLKELIGRISTNTAVLKTMAFVNKLVAR